MDVEGAKLLPVIMLLIGVAAMIGGAMALTVSKVGNTMTQCYNTSYATSTDGSRCVGTFLNGERTVNMSASVGPDSLNVTNEYYTIIKGQSGIKTGSEQISTLAIVYVMIIIIGALMSVFAYFKFFG